MAAIKLAVTAALLGMTFAVQAEDMKHDMAMEHGGTVNHMFRLETDYGASRNGGVATWDLDGWVGTDENKLWLKSEGEHQDGKLEDGEFWAMYSRNIATFWDAQAGLRQDVGPNAATYATFGFNGLAPYYFETEAHLFISNKGKVSARLREENDFLLTQKLITQPYAELNAYAQDVPEQHIGAGLSDAKLGLQTRYEFTRKFAPYIDVSYGRKFGETSAIAKSNGEDINEFIGAIGLRLMF
jgi:copper resistance protein B